MRAEEKQLEGPDLERDMRVEQSHQEEHEEAELPVLAGEEARDVGFDQRSRLFDAIQLILARAQVNVSLLYLPERESRALEALQTATTGHDSIGEFVFAEDRKGLLEQSLAILQQNLTYGDPKQLAELHGKFDSLTDRIAELRAELLNLEDAQEELIEGRDRGMEQVPKGDEDKPEDGDAVDDLFAGQTDNSTLTGPERAQQPKPPSSLSGPERPPAEEARLVAPKRSTLSGPELPPEKPAASTLGGPELAPASKPASTLGDDAPAQPDASAKKPWWKRPFG